ncbi:hypothetical protein NQ317_002801 [Molorchus minor]|uniref:CCHC-type domain-containing protein n=1 Tax=Molorchus minor TaxID=1323400 RepID=A0ABQ9J745_9CUCU|nr:hypothetical protein NQ317_002801 [Molorchus minor]
MASGNLNDNFVLVNLKKKVFVRVNTRSLSGRVSKPKRLSGPDMDMGGCDGGMLTCFSCGQIGHFSRNCKGLNGDGLLPLVADQEEECPYPTLEGSITNG